MDNKYLVELFVPTISKIYNVYLPINRRVGNVIALLNKSLTELSKGEYRGSNSTSLYDRETGEKLDNNLLVRDTIIENGSGIIII
jgi:hypothetical protein